MSPAACGQGERYGVRDDEKPPGSVFSFLHRRGAFFLFDKAEKKEWGSQKRRALDQYKRTELNGETPVRGISSPPERPFRVFFSCFSRKKYK